MIKPFPPFWPRNLDLVTPLSLQRALDPDLKLFYCVGHVSVPLERVSPRREPIKTELGGIIERDTVHRGMTKVTYGAPRRTGVELPQDEILEDVITYTVPKEVPEVVLGARGVREKIPKAFEDIEVFHGSDEVFYMQTSKGNRTRSLRRMLQLPLSNPYYMAKEGLILHGFIKPYDFRLRRMRSILRTDWIATETKGWRELEAHHLPLQRTLCSDKWWQDTAIPHPISSRIDSRLVKALVYLLDKRDELIAI